VQAQIRIYTINRGELDNWLTHFKEETLPLHEAVGWPVVAMWVNRPQNEVIWIRTHKDAADLEAKTKAFSEGAAARGIQLGGIVAKMEVREVESADIGVAVS
jgi:hypothetical protein